jgi:uncharacterized repeat protein (TIGR03803 family)
MYSHKSSLDPSRIVIAVFIACLVVANAFATTEKVVHSFQGDPDGSSPQASLVADSAGNLYGTTKFGGSGPGTVFELSPPATVGGAWAEQVLHAFQNSPDDGAIPTGTLVFDKQGNLYGTTQGGGPFNTGTIFELSPPATAGGAWTETILWTFPSGLLKGYEPAGKLSIDGAGDLYGTTALGKARGTACDQCGVVFELVKPKISGQLWSERVLYQFGLVANDGISPSSDLLLRGGMLYGTTQGGGVHKFGIVFQLAPHTGLWTETILHNFSSSEGIAPQGGLIADAAGNLFGTLPAEGNNPTCSCGTIYELSPPAVAGGSWQETTLYSFAGLSDGARPYGPLWRDPQGDLFGTTTLRGESQHGGAGTVFKLKAPAASGGAWTFVLLHDFGTTTNDGGSPQGGLILRNSLLYGTTQSGEGTTDNGAVFSVVP